MNKEEKYLLTYFSFIIIAFIATLSLYSMQFKSIFIYIPMHAAVESTGALISLVVAYILYRDFLDDSVPLNQSEMNWVVLALLGMGMFDFFHAIAMPGNTFVWLHSLAVFTGGTLFACAVLLGFVRINKQYACITVFITTIIISTLSMIKPELVPIMLQDDHFSPLATTMNETGAIAYLVASIGFLTKYYKVKHSRSFIVLSSHCALFFLSSLMFHFSALWDISWWSWHVLRFAAYFVLLYFVVTYLKQNTAFKEIDFINRARQIVDQEHEVDTILLSCVRYICDVTHGAIGCAVLLADAHELENHYYWHVAPDSAIKPLNQTITNDIIRTREEIYIRDLTKSLPTTETHAYQNCHIKSVFGFPVFYNNQVIATIEIYAAHQDQLNINLLQAFRKQISLSLENKIAKRKLEQIAHFDWLTGLPNRSYFMALLNRTLSKHQREKTSFVLIYIDIDNFKQINDIYGHNIGDNFLKIVTDRINKHLRSSDFFARIGGDEFAFITDDYKGINSVAKIANHIIENIRSKVVVDGVEILTSASIGIAVSPPNGCTALEILRRADVAMYKAKSLNKNTFQFYSDEMNQLYQRHILLENSLKSAIDNAQLSIVFQPQIDLYSSEIYGFEALARWRCSEVGLITATEWIIIAEKLGIIEEIGAWVLTHACHQFNQWKGYFEAANITPKLSINISILQLYSDAIITQVKQALEIFDYPPDRLVLEITETKLIEHFREVKLRLDVLKELGVEIALDDFGKGYSSLSYLNMIKFDTLKIDCDITRDLATNVDSIIVFKAIAMLAKGFGVNVIVEGVENRAQEREIKACLATFENSQIVQGYLYSEPLTVEAVPVFIQENSCLIKEKTNAR